MLKYKTFVENVKKIKLGTDIIKRVKINNVHNHSKKETRDTLIV